MAYTTEPRFDADVELGVDAEFVPDPSLLSSLSPRNLREGFAEVIKHGFIMDPPMLAISS